MSGGWFITGTDTGVGKTRVAESLLRTLARQGQRAVGMKPVASGCHVTASGLRSEDAERLLAAGSAPVDYADVNPYAFAPAIAPHLAAREAGVEMRLEKILDGFQRLQRSAPWIVVEGAGGWMAPLGERLMFADVVRAMQLPVIVVVGLQLGCLNHALLTVAAIECEGIPVAGWVANSIDPAMARVEENIATLSERIAAPLLARFPHAQPGDSNASDSVFPFETLIRSAAKAD